MNNNRLATNNNSYKITALLWSLQMSLGRGGDIKDLYFKVNYFLTNSNLEIHDNGQIFIKTSQVYLKGRGNIQIEVFTEEGALFQSIESIKMAALFFNTSERSIFSKLDSGDKIFFNEQYYTPKRVTPLI
jgi:hypothetical protein